MTHEWLRQPVRWIRDDGIDPAGLDRLEVQEILNAVLALAVVDNVVFEDRVTGAAQHLADGPATAGRLQDCGRQRLVGQQRKRGHLGRFVEIVSASESG